MVFTCHIQRRVTHWHHRVPKELISRFVKLCPTCRERRGAICSIDDDNMPSKTPATATTTTSITTMPTNIALSLPEEVRSPLKRRRSPSINEGGMTNSLDMPSQLANSSSAFKHQNRWLSDLSPRSTYDEHYTIAAPYPLHTGFRGLDSATVSSPGSLPMKQDMSQDAKHISMHPSHQQQELHFGYD